MLFAEGYSAYRHVEREAFISGAEDAGVTGGGSVRPLDHADDAIIRNTGDSSRQGMVWLEDGAIRRGGIGIGGDIEITRVCAREALEEVFQAAVLEGGAGIGVGSAAATSVRMDADGKSIGDPNDGTARVSGLGIGLILVKDVVHPDNGFTDEGT